MPDINEIMTLPTIDIDISSKMDEHHQNKNCQLATPEDILHNLSNKWHTPIESEEFARKLDENDSLNHVRDEFFMPKISNLPKGICPNDSCLSF